MSSPENISFSPLQPDVAAQLEAGPGLVYSPAANYLLSADEYDGFGHMFANNFFLHFNSGLTGTVYRQQKHYQRFSILYPELNQALQEDPQQRRNIAGWDDLEPALRQAYELMRHLVDLEDPYVRDGGQVDSIFLSR